MEEDRLELPVVACERCEVLCKSRKRIVNSKGPAQASIMLVGEGPGKDEDLTGKPFMGQAGIVVARLLDDAGIDTEDIHVTNAVRCRPPGNRTPKIDEIRNCRPYLLEEIRQTKPRVIIAVGATALTSLMGKATSIGSVLGQVLTQPETGVPIVPTYHPAYLMRGKWGLAPLVTAHLVRAKQVAQGTIKMLDLEQLRAEVVRPVLTLEAVREMRDILVNYATVITLDTESYGVQEWTGLDWLGAEVLCYSFGMLDSDGAVPVGFVLPILQQGGKSYWNDQLPEVLQYLDEILRCPVPKAIQNAGHDIRLIERDQSDPIDPLVRTAHGLYIENLAFDTMIMQRLLDENIPASESTMTALYTGIPYYEAEIMEESNGKLNMDEASNKTLWEYAGLDGYALACVLEVLLRKMAKQPALEWILREISMPMIRSCWGMTRRGVGVDIDYFAELCDRYDKLVAAARAEVFEVYGHGEFNLNSRPQLREALFGVLKIPATGMKTKAGRACDDCLGEAAGGEPCRKHEATGKDALTAMYEAHPHPMLKALIRYYGLIKQKGTYVNGSDGEGGVLQFIRDDLRVHPEYGVNTANTGRLGAYRPPIQTIPKGVDDEVLGHNILRRPYVPTPGRRLGEADWSQGELWVMGYLTARLCDDTTLLDLLKSGRDVHTYVARTMCNMGLSSVFPKAAAHPEMSDNEWKGLFDELRRHAKVFVFGIDYGMTEAGISQRTGSSMDDAARLRRAYTSQVFPGLDTYFAMIDEMLEGGPIPDEFGRLGHFPDMALLEGRNKDKGDVKRVAYNMPIQAGLNDLHQYMQPRFEIEFTGRVYTVTAVHDSIMFEFDPNGTMTDEEIVTLMWEIKNYAENIAKTLEKWDGSVLGWDIPIEVAWGDSWAHMPNKITAGGELKVEGNEEG